ncbi:MAG TPA: DPP IV N-terminal domain-containing protein [Gemmataceae bacterium]|jgi:dipeptidyl aminopeptidase/acylaminoacyl peptidase|nr:DPP IV N-terminal domain-containing protein [Gemmataceae bacterium]
MHPIRALALVCVLLAVSPAVAEMEKVTGANYPLAAKFNQAFIQQHVQEASVFPTFIGKTDQFWYSVRTPNGTKYWRIDPTRKSKEALFDTAKLAAQLSELVQKPIDTDTLELSRVTVTEDGNKLRFVHSDFQFEYEFGPAKLNKLGKAAPAPFPLPKGNMDERTREQLERMREERERIEKEGERKETTKKEDVKKDEEVKKDDIKKEETKKEETKVEGKGGGRRFGTLDYKAYSPDRKRYVFAQKHNLYLADEGKEAEATQLTTDGEEDYSFSSFGGRFGGQTRTEGKIPPADRKVRPNVTWSPDSKDFYVTRTDRRGIKELYLVDALANPRPNLVKYPYPMPGEEAVFRSELFYCDAAAKKITKVPLKWAYESYPDIHWGKTGDELRFIRRDRPQRHLEFCALNTKTGEAKCMIGDGFDAAFLDLQPAKYVDESDEMIWWSERSGWGHYYLYGRDGKLKNPITSGAWRASRIVDVDAKNRILYFTANGREEGENIYYNHLYRIRFDGTDLTLLDPSDTCFNSHDEHCRGANHSSYMSPSKRYIVTTCSRVDSAPMSYVLDEKGGRVMELERTDLTALQKTGWKLPETFCVKAADGVTTLFGNMWKPFDFDPKKKYPIIAHVYPGPQQEGVTHRFSAYGNNQQMAQLGFIVIQVGHRGGTPERSKAYHSYGYYNLRDYALADKKAAIEQLAATHPFIDLDRVGIYGHSGGAFLSAAALLQKPYNDFFKAAVASAGNHDNNIYNDNWSERYHGLKEIPPEAKDTAKKENIPPAKPGDEDEDVSEPDDKKDEKKADDKKVEAKKDDVKKTEDKKVEAKKDDTKKTEDKKVETKKEEAKKTEDKKVDAKKDDVKKTEDNKVEAKKEEAKEDETPKAKYEIKVPTNAELAANLKGHLLLVHGDMDNNVHPANTIRLVDALIKANKRFDMLILPGKSHAFMDEQPYFTQRMWDFFAEHLLDDRQTGADIYDKKPGRK